MVLLGLVFGVSCIYLWVPCIYLGCFVSTIAKWLAGKTRLRNDQFVSSGTLNSTKHLYLHFLRHVSGQLALCFFSINETQLSATVYGYLHGRQTNRRHKSGQVGYKAIAVGHELTWPTVVYGTIVKRETVTERVANKRKRDRQLYSCPISTVVKNISRIGRVLSFLYKLHRFL